MSCDQKHEEKACPRCGRLHVCKMNNIVHCDCGRIDIPKGLAQFIQTTYDDCLCLCCLRILVASWKEAPGGGDR